MTIPLIFLDFVARARTNKGIVTIMIRALAGFSIVVLIVPGLLGAQELVEDTVSIMKARVLEVVSQEEQLIPGTDVATTYQTIQVRVLDGPQEGNQITVENDYLTLEEGDVFYLTHTTNEVDGTDYYAIGEPYRLPILGVLTALFVGVVVFFGGKQGVRGLLSLVASLVVILFVLLPGILAGYSPILMVMGIASLIVIIGSYVTHGLNKMTTTAVLGMIGTIGITGVLASLTISAASLSGFTSDEVTYLNFNTRGAIDLAGLLLGGILIGLLGVLYDAAIGQAVAVEELSSAGAHLSRREVYQRALRIGREHIGALVNTLAIAYVGASLPLLLLFYGTVDLEIGATLNRELFASEIVRILVSSIGIIMVVPVTTLLATFMLVPNKGQKSSEQATDKGHDTSFKHQHRHIHTDKSEG